MKKYSYRSFQGNFPHLFSLEKARIISSIHEPLDIEHVGSTAVSGLGGKGIIDIAIATCKGSIDAVSTELKELGYEFRENASTPERLFFRADLPDDQEDIRRYHIHLTFFESTEWNDLIAFRDYLKSHPKEVEKYKALKKQAAEKANDDGAAYRKLKDPFFKACLEKMRKVTFEKTITNAFGKTGNCWLKKLPKILDFLKKHWQLSDIIPINNMTYHYVAKAIDKQNIPIVLKIGCDKTLDNSEAAVLKHFDSKGAIRLIDYNQEYSALLLEQAMPGISLKAHYLEDMGFVMDVYADVVKKIQRHPLPEANSFQTIDCWLTAIDKTPISKIPKELLTRAILVKNKLLSTMTQKKLLHGDLHLDNILENNKKWVCIDPKGIIGESEFEVAAFDIFTNSEIGSATTDEFINRIKKLAKKTNLSFERLKDWFFVRLILSAAWSIEDKQDPSKAIKLGFLLHG